MNIKIIRALGIRSKDPAIIATVDSYRVRWGSRKPWSCDCLTDLDKYECTHIVAVRELMDARVFQPLAQLTPPL